METETVHHIRGSLTDITEAETTITDALCGEIRTDSQCVEDSGQFGFGGMYVGTMECSLDLPYSMKDELKGGTITLDFGAETASGIEWVPLGVWTITECSRDSSDRIKITGSDNLSRLRVETENEKKRFVGVVKVYKLMEHVTKLTGVQFAQTIAELEELSGLDLGQWWATHYGNSAWHEVKSITQLLGCFAFANREGKIEFRRLDKTTPVLEIPAERRHSSQLEEYNYSIRAVKYSDTYGHTTIQHFGGADNAGAVLGFSDCLLVWETTDEPDAMYTRYLDNIHHNLAKVKFTPGTVEYYGNPALDIGDYVTISGGTAKHSGAIPFLICCNSWQFRGPQTLTACGFSEAIGGNGSQSPSSETEQLRNISVTKSINNIILTDYPGELFDTERTAAKGGFSCRSQTNCFLDCSMIFLGNETGNVVTKVYIDDVAQAFNPVSTVHEGEYVTQHFQLPLSSAGGSHVVEIGVLGACSIEQISAYVWGQNITEICVEPTGESDYIYSISGKSAEIVEYIGTSISPEIPETLEGAQVTKIGGSAFTYSDIESVYIPEGVTEIE